MEMAVILSPIHVVVAKSNKSILRDDDSRSLDPVVIFYINRTYKYVGEFEATYRIYLWKRAS